MKRRTSFQASLPTPSPEVPCLKRVRCSSPCSTQSLPTVGAVARFLKVEREGSVAELSSLHKDDASAEIFHWQDLEVRLQPCSTRVWQLQTSITPQNRCVLVDWMFELCSLEFKLAQETFFLAVNYVDRFLARCDVSRQQLQLVGATCLWIAGKYEEVRAPTAMQLTTMALQSFKVKDMIEMEVKILLTLKYELGPPTMYKFMTCFGTSLVKSGVQLDVLLVRHLIELATLSSGPANSPGALDLRSSNSDSDLCNGAEEKMASASPFVSPKTSPPTRPLVRSESGISQMTPETLFDAQTSPGEVRGASEALVARRQMILRQAQGLAECSLIARALPSHVAAAALFATLQIYQKDTIQIIETLSAMACCPVSLLLDLCSALRKLGALLSSSSVSYAMIKLHRQQRAVWQQRIKASLLRAQLQGLTGPQVPVVV